MGKKEAVAFIDDDAGLRAMAQVALSNIGGFEAHVFDGVESALDKLAVLSRCRVVVLDIHLGDGSGFELAETIWRTLGSDMPPVLFLSADDVSMVKTKIAVPSNFIVGRLVKPFDPLSLADQIRTLTRPRKLTSKSMSGDGGAVTADVRFVSRTQVPGGAPANSGDANGPRQIFLRDLTDRLAVLWEDKEPLEQRLDVVIVALHALAGGGATFGYPALGLAAQHGEQLARGAKDSMGRAGQADFSQASDQRLMARLTETLLNVVALGQAAAGGETPLDPGQPFPPEAASGDMPMVLLREPDPRIRQALEGSLQQCGIMVMHDDATGTSAGSPEEEDLLILEPFGVQNSADDSLVSSAETRPDLLAQTLFAAWNNRAKAAR